MTTYYSTSAGTDLLKGAAKDRDQVFSLIGQLVSKLAEIDLAMLAAVYLLKRDEVIAQYAADWYWRTNQLFTLVERLLLARAASEALLNNLRSLRTDATPLLDRRAIAAHNVVVLSWMRRA